MYRKAIRSKKCSDAKNNIRDNIRTAYGKYGKNKVTNASRKVIRSKKCNEAKNNIRDNIRTAYVKYGNIRKSKYTKTPYSNIRSMYLEHGKKYRLHRCERYVYIKPVLRKADTHTHKRTAKCTVSRSKQSGTERKQETLVLYVRAHIVYSKLTIVGTSTHIKKLNTQSKKGYVNGEKYAFLKKGSRDITCVIEGTKLSGGRLKNCDKTVSGDYGILSVRSKMEAKPEDGPEMDVDGATPEGQNSKKLNIISSCEPLVICILYVKVLNKINSITVTPLYRIQIISHSRSILPKVDRYNAHICHRKLTSYLCNSVQSLAVILSDSLHASIPLSPYKEYFMLFGVHTNTFRQNRYRE
jgi:hypothetical protein